MPKLRTARVWARLAACLAIAAFSAGSAFAEQQDDQNNQSDQKQQQAESSQQEDSQSSSQSDEQKQQNAQQDQQQRDREAAGRTPQTNERSQQQRQRDNQQREGAASDQWNGDRSGREWPSRRFDRDNEFSRDAQRSASGPDERSLLNPADRDASRWPEPEASDEQGASLGVNLTSDDGPGIVLIRVHDGSPADRMGLRVRDRITQVNGQPIRSVDNFITRIREMRPGSEVELSVTRDRNERTFRGELESRREAFASQGEFRRNYEFDRYPENRGNWQTSYDEEERGPSSDTYVEINPRDAAIRIEDLQRQADRLARQVEELRDAIRDASQSGGYRMRGETPARYEENPSNRSRETRAYERWRSDNDRYPQSSDNSAERRSNDSSDSNRQWRDSSSNSPSSGTDSDKSSGGEIGEDRLHVGSEDINE